MINYICLKDFEIQYYENLIYFSSVTALKINFFLYWSIDRDDPNPGGQATFYGGHKITVLNLA